MPNNTSVHGTILCTYMQSKMSLITGLMSLTSLFHVLTTNWTQSITFEWISLKLLLVLPVLLGSQSFRSERGVE